MHLGQGRLPAVGSVPAEALQNLPHGPRPPASKAPREVPMEQAQRLVRDRKLNREDQGVVASYESTKIPVFLKSLLISTLLPMATLEPLPASPTQYLFREQLESREKLSK